MVLGDVQALPGDETADSKDVEGVLPEATMDTGSIVRPNGVQQQYWSTFDSVGIIACPVGMRRIDDPCVPREVCLPTLEYPSALSMEAMNPTGPTPTVRACGAWQADAVRLGFPPGTSYALHEATEVGKAMWRRVEARLATPGWVVPSAPNKLMHGCGALRGASLETQQLALKTAYQQLMQNLGDVETRLDVMRALGHLSSYGCKSLVYISLESSVEGFTASLVQDEPLLATAVAQALRLVGESEEVIANAELALDALFAESADRCEELGALHALSTEAVSAIVSGALGESITISLSASSQQSHLMWPRRAWCAHSETTPHLTEAMLRGIAADCAATAAQLIHTPTGDATGRTTRSQELTGVNGALGAWSEAPTSEEWRRGNPIRLPNAITKTEEEEEAEAPKAILAAALPLGTAGCVEGNVCFDTVRLFATDYAEELLFSSVVTELLYTRLQTLTQAIRQAIGQVLFAEPFRSVFADSMVARQFVNSARIRISGATRGSWAGRQTAAELVAPESTDGVVSAVLLHLRERTRAELRIALLDEGDPCDVPPLFAATEPNAYYLSHPGCVLITLGLLRMPLADESYDDISLLGRIGFVIAHELFHATVRIACVPPTTLCSWSTQLTPCTRRPLQTWGHSTRFCALTA